MCVVVTGVLSPVGALSAVTTRGALWDIALQNVVGVAVGETPAQEAMSS